MKVAYTFTFRLLIISTILTGNFYRRLFYFVNRNKVTIRA